MVGVRVVRGRSRQRQSEGNVRTMEYHYDVVGWSHVGRFLKLLKFSRQWIPKDYH